MSELSFGVKIWGDIRNLLDSLAKGKSSVDEFGKKTSGSFKDLQKDVYRAENTFKNLAYQLGINSKEAQEALTKFRALSEQSKAITQAVRPPKDGFMGNLKGELMGVAAGYLGVTALAGSVGSFFKTCIEGAAGDERALRRLSSSLNDNQSDIENMVSFKEEMMQSTLFSEDDIMGAITMGVELGRTEEQTKKMVQTAMGLSNVTGQDLNTVMLQLSGTFEGNLGKLGRLNPALKDLSAEQLANGDAIELLNNKFGKLAGEGLTTIEGRVSQAKKKFEEFTDSIGESILKFLGFQAIQNNTELGKLTQQENSDIASFTKMGKSDQKAYIDGWQKQQDEYFKKYEDAKKRGDDVNRAHLSIQFSDTKTFLDKLKLIYSEVPKQSKEELKAGLEAQKREWDAYVEFMNAKASGNLVGPRGDQTIGQLTGDTGIEKLTGIGTNNVLGGGARVMTGTPGGATGVQGRTVTDMKSVTDAINEAAAAMSGFGAGFQRTFAAMGQIAIKFKEGFKGKWQDTMAAFAEMAQGAVELVSGLFTASSNKRLQEFDDQYNAQRSAIENSKMSEEQKKKAIDKLDADSARKRKELQRQAAKDQKTANLFQAVIGGALAVVQAYAIPVVGMLMGTLMLGLVAAQVAAIASQPLPALASGGLAHAPTMALVGDNPNARIDPEVIAPLSKLRQYMGGEGGSGSLVAVVKGNDIHFMLQRVAKAQSRI